MNIWGSGFLICVPMLEEWKTPEGIKVIDGWSFQVRSLLRIFFVQRTHFQQFSSECVLTRSFLDSAEFP
jgi:hypothetical protein